MTRTIWRSIAALLLTLGGVFLVSGPAVAAGVQAAPEATDGTDLITPDHGDVMTPDGGGYIVPLDEPGAVPPEGDGLILLDHGDVITRDGHGFVVLDEGDEFTPDYDALADDEPTIVPPEGDDHITPDHGDVGDVITPDHGDVCQPGAGPTVDGQPNICASPVGHLPQAGGAAQEALWLGVGLLAIGAAFVWLGQRRKANADVRSAPLVPNA